MSWLDDLLGVTDILRNGVALVTRKKINFIVTDDVTIDDNESEERLDITITTGSAAASAAQAAADDAIAAAAAAQSTANAAAPASRLVSTASGSGLTGGGNLSADRSLSVVLKNSTITKDASGLETSCTHIGAVPTSRTLTTDASSGLSGGGDLSADRSFAVVPKDGSLQLTSTGVRAHALRATPTKTGASYAAQDLDLCVMDPVTAAQNQVVTAPTPATDARFAVAIAGDTEGYTVTVNPNGAETFNGAASYVLSVEGEWAIWQYDGTRWVQIG